MQTRTLIAVVTALAGSAAAADAQNVLNLDWRIGGLQNVTINPGDTVTVSGRASWVGGSGLSNTMFKVALDGYAAGDAIAYNEAPAAAGLGRNTSLRTAPQTLTDAATATGRAIQPTVGTTIQALQLAAITNPLFNASNPIDVFKFIFTAGPAGHTVDVSSLLNSSMVFAVGAPTSSAYTVSMSPAHITVVPAAGPTALLGLASLTAIRRRRAA